MHSLQCSFLNFLLNQIAVCYFVALIWLAINYIYTCCHVFFLKHILLFSITIEFHNVSKIEFIHINHFLDNIDSFVVDSGTLVLNCHTPFSLPMATPIPFETVHPPPPCSS